MDRAGAKAGDYVCARGTLRVTKRLRASAFEVYLSVTELQLLDAPATLNGRRQEASTLQMPKSVAPNRNLFPERTKPTIAVIHSRSQEAQVYADFCQPLRALDSTLSLQPMPANMLSVPELTHAIRAANADILALIRDGGSDEQFSVFENPELLRAWSDKRAYRVLLSDIPETVQRLTC